MVEEPDRQEAEHQRPRGAPEPDVLVQRVHERCDEYGEGGLQGKLYYDAMPASPTGRPQDSLDIWMREVVDWHFDPATGTPFWLDYASKAGWDPRREILPDWRVAYSGAVVAVLARLGVP